MRILILVQHHVGYVVMGQILGGLIDFEAGLVIIVVVFLGVMHTPVYLLDAAVVVIFELETELQLLAINFEFVSLSICCSVFDQIL